jgi:hypothetical protein
MYQSKKQYFYGTGRRKKSVARVRLYPNGSGAITINGRDIESYFGLDTLKLIVRQPFGVTDSWASTISKPPSSAAGSPARPAPSATGSPAPGPGQHRV